MPRIHTPPASNQTDKEPLANNPPSKSTTAGRTPEKSSNMEPPSPGFRGTNSGTIPKRRASIEKPKFTNSKKDGQHRDASNCGCHQCVVALSYIKNEPLTPGQEISVRFREQLKKLKIFKNTSIKSHPNPCMCKTHLEKMPSRTITENQRGNSNITGSTTAERNKVSNLRTQFESGTTQRVDPRTGQPPPDPNNIRSNSQESGHISVITSR